MTDGTSTDFRRIALIAVGLVAVAVGLLLLLVGSGIPVTYCVSGTGIAETCTTDQVAQAKALGLLLAGLLAVGLGGRTTYRALRA